MNELVYGSVCSGIEAASVAWHPLGWRAAFLSEIEPFPRAVLAHHYPTVPLHGDFTTIQKGDYAAIDVLVGGTPCQSFSVAGLRAGLDDPRGNLMLEFGALAERLGPRWLVWENVPGVLSSNRGRDFGTFLGMLAEIGYGFAYRILDAQYFGVAQRRRRVFVVGYLGDWRPAAAVLFERESMRRDSPPRREAGKGAAPGSARSVALRGRDGGGTIELGDDIGGCLRASVGGGDKPHVITMANGHGGAKWPADLAPTLNAHFGEKQGLEDQHINGGAGLFVPAVRVTGDITHTLKADGFDASEDGTGRGQPIIAFSCKDHGGDAGSISPTLRSMGHAGSHANAGGQVAVAFDILGTPASEVAKETSVHTPLRARVPGQFENSTVTMAVTAMQVRRLTPRECERLQGFPDDYTLVPHTRGKPAADGPRYKALGNSMAVPVMRWIGERIAFVDSIVSTN